MSYLNNYKHIDNHIKKNLNLKKRNIDNLSRQISINEYEAMSKTRIINIFKLILFYVLYLILVIILKKLKIVGINTVMIMSIVGLIYISYRIIILYYYSQAKKVWEEIGAFNSELVNILSPGDCNNINN